MIPLLVRAALTIFVCFVLFSADATSYMDPPDHDPDALCHGSQLVDQQRLYKVRAASVFSVLANYDNKLQAKGTATLVDDERGIFITAGHVIHFYRNSPIWISQKTRGQPGLRQYRVHVFPPGTTTDDWSTVDLVLLQAENWDKPAQLVPLPFRIDAIDEYIKGFYIGHAEDQDSSIFGEFNVAFGSGSSSDTITFSGTAFPHASGALLLDGQGRAFALLIRDAEVAPAGVAGMTTKQLRRILWDSNYFSAFSLRSGLGKIKDIPLSANGRQLAEAMMKHGFDEEFFSMIQRVPITAIDTVHLTDIILSEQVWRPLAANLKALVLVNMYPIVAKACTHRYFANALAQAYRSASLQLPEFRPSSEAIAERKPESRASLWSEPEADDSDSSSRILNELRENFPLKLAKDMGMYFLREAMTAREERPELARIHAKFAEALLVGAANRQNVLNAVVNGVRRREYAALMANIALTEDILGDQLRAREAIFCADALGGSAIAYQLAAKYALVQGDVLAATGLYARAYSILAGDGARSQALRNELNREFGRLVVLDPSTAGASPSTYRIPPRSTSKTTRWYDLGSGNAAVSLSELAIQLALVGKLYESEMLLSRALSVDESLLGRDHPQVAVDLQNLAAVYVPQSRHAHARRLIDRALAINTKAFGPTSEEVAGTLHNLGVVHRELRQYDDAAKAFSRVLSIRRGDLRSNSAQLVFDLQYLGSIHGLLGQYLTAETLYREAFTLSHENGVDRENIATSAYNLAILSILATRQGDAISLLTQALEIDLQMNEMRRVLDDYKILAVLYYNSGNFEKAKEMVELARKIEPRQFEEDVKANIGPDGIIREGLGGRDLMLDDGRVVRVRRVPMSAERWLEARREDVISQLVLRRPPFFEGVTAQNSGRSQLYPLR
jgi:tetratricopeptide (TPR) repeat protein